MNNLLNFLIKHSAWFVFTFFVIASCWLLFKRNPYQQSVYFTSANTVTASLLEGYSNVTGYFNLRETNSELEARNAQLEMELVDTRAQLAELKAHMPDSTLASAQVLSHFDYVMARVISNSVSEPYNYITINRGSSDGIKTQTGVVSHNGVVGIVGVVGPHASRVISMLNPEMKLSCKIKGSEYPGTMTWDGKSVRHALLQELPKHGEYNKGDTVITSGFSSIFPEGVIVGIVEGKVQDASDNFTSLRVRLATDFSRLDAVRVIDNKLRPELDDIQREDHIESPLDR